jgi:hypothetical protein
VRTFSGLAQIGVINYVGNNLYREIFGFSIDNEHADKENFQGFAQLGAVNLTDGGFFGALQVAALANLVYDFHGFAQIAPAGNYVNHRFYGFTQIGAVNAADEFTGAAQIGVVNWSSRRTRGAQIGLFNSSKRLQGVQLGLVNVAEEGGLPVTPLMNLGW